MVHQQQFLKIGHSKILSLSKSIYFLFISCKIKDLGLCEIRNTDVFFFLLMMVCEIFLAEIHYNHFKNKPELERCKHTKYIQHSDEQQRTRIEGKGSPGILSSFKSPTAPMEYPKKPSS